MIRTALAALMALSLFSCNLSSSGQDIENHWSWRSIMPRMNRAFLGYDANIDGSYRDFAHDRKQAVELDLRRHFFNHNPDNPNHPDVESRYEPRPANSLIYNPVRYIHAEGLLIGAALMPATGGFIPLPIDSILGTADRGGWSEFVNGVDNDLEDFEVVSASIPPALGVKGEDVVISTVTEVKR